jgi:hypothetical protein
VTREPRCGGRLHSWRCVRLLSVLMTVTAPTGACSEEGPRIVDALDPARRTVLGEGPVTAFTGSPDGTLFATGRSDLFRMRAGDTTKWEVVAELPFHAIAVHAADRDNVFALAQLSADVWHWRAGETPGRLETPLSDSIIRQGHSSSGVPLVALTGTGKDPLVAVGDRGAIVRLSGNGSTLEESPLDSVARRAAPDWYASALWRVDSFEGRFYAASQQHLLARGDGAWRMLGLPAGAENWSIEAVAATATGVAVSFTELAGRPRLFLHTDGRWIDLTGKLRGLTQPLVGGRAQADGSALFWSMSSFVVEVRGASVRTYRIRDLGALRGAARSGAHLYAGGTHEARLGVVIRLNRD